MRFFLSFCVCILSFLNLSAQQQYLDNVVQTQLLSKEIADLFSQKKFDELFDKVELYIVAESSELEILRTNTIIYVEKVESVFGNSNGYYKSGTEVIGDFAVRETYLIKYELSAIRLRITYYKGTNGWVMNAFNWDDNFKDEFVKKD